MPSLYQTDSVYHTEEMQDIITAPPSWLLKWGISLFFAILLGIILLSSLIHYPDLVKTQLVISSLNTPKPIVAKVSGRLIKILIDDNQMVNKDQPLAYLESTADHGHVLKLLADLKILQHTLQPASVAELKWINSPSSMQLGELQSAYENFYQAYLLFKASSAQGFNLKKKGFLSQDLKSINVQRKQLMAQKALQDKDYDLANEEFNMHQELNRQKVETTVELRREESKLIAKKFPLEQTEAALLTNSTTYQSKEKDLLELDNLIQEQRFKFTQSLNSMISMTEEWKNKYVLSASQSGKVIFSGIIQENQFVNANQELFYINSGNGTFFGVMAIPQYNMGKIKLGQKVLVKLKSYPFEEYGAMQGRISKIADVPMKDSVFSSRVNFTSSRYSEMKRPVSLKNGMLADAEVITEDASLIHRLSRSLIKMLR